MQHGVLKYPNTQTPKHLSLALSLPLLAGLLLTISLVLPARAQTRLATQFERDVNRYSWVAEVGLEQRLGAWRIAIANRFQSNAFLLVDDRLSFHDEARLAWEAARPLGPGLAVGTRGRMAWYSLSRVWSQEAYAMLRYAARDDLWIEPALGVAWDRRPGVATDGGAVPLRMDVGPAYGFRLEATPAGLQAYALHLTSDASWQALAPRRGRALRLQGSAERQIEQTRFRAEVHAASFRRDAYQSVSFLNRGSGRSETIEATTSDTLLASLDVEAALHRILTLTGRLDVGLNNRFIRTHRAPDEALFFDTNFNRRAVNAEVGLRLTTRRVRGRLAVQTGAEIEQRQLANRDRLPPAQASQRTTLLRQADYDEGSMALSGNLQADLGRRFVLTAGGTASILRHDTPDVNPDDRDEVYQSGQLGLLVRLSPVLEASVQVFGTFYHTVYLLAERSAENNIQRSLRFRPSVRWRPSDPTDVRFTAEVRATYTVDDFVLAGRRPNDQSAREMSYTLEVDQDLGAGLRLRANAGLSDLRLGRLLWDTFAEIPSDTLRTYSGWLRLQAGRRITAEVGLRAFIRSDYDRAATVQYEAVDETGTVLRDDDGAVVYRTITRPGRMWIAQLGPTCSIAWPMRMNATLRLDGWLNVQRVFHRLYGDLPEASAARIRRAARHGQRTLIPNLTMSVDWRF